MSSVYKNNNSKYWIAAFRDANGKRRNRSTKIIGTEKNKRQAAKLAEQYELAATRRQTSLQARRTITELHKELNHDDLVTVTVETHVAQWLESKRTSVSAATISHYEVATRKFLSFLGVRRDAELSEITREDIEGFRDEQAAKLSAQTTNHCIKALRMLFRDARDRSLLVDDPTEFVKPVKAKKVIDRRPFSIPEVEKILACCDDEWRSMVLFGLYTGQRLGDIARITWNSVDLKTGTFSITTSKTDKALRVPLHPSLLNHLKSLPAPIDNSLPVHPIAAEIIATRGQTSLLSNRFTRILVTAGLRQKRPHRALGEGRDGRRTLHSLSFHSLRRTATTLLHEAGVAQGVAMALIGHDSVDIHYIYASVGEPAMREGANKMPAVGE